MSDSDRPFTVVDNVFHYNPSVPLAIVAGVLFTINSSFLFARVFKKKHWWGLCLPIGSICYALGFYLRIPVRNTPNSLGLFIIMQLFLVCSPAAFLAFNYIVYGRLIETNIGAKYSLIRPSIVARVFVISDVVTFLIQGGGGGIQANQDQATLGANILLAGLILQTLSYFFFVGLVGYTHWKIVKEDELPKSAVWWRVFRVLYVSSTFILIRGIYRVIELAQGDGGYLLTHEVFLYALDTLPLFFATIVYAPFWPGTYIYYSKSSSDRIQLQDRA